MKSIAKIHAAATYFAFVSRDINAIAQAFRCRYPDDPTLGER